MLNEAKPGKLQAGSTYSDAEQQEQDEKEAKMIAENQTTDNPVGQLMNDLQVGVVDFFDNSRDRQEIIDDRALIRGQATETNQQISESIDAQEGFNALPREATRAVVGGVAGIAETTLNTGNYVWDFTEGYFNENQAEENDVWGENYEWADWDLGIADNKSFLGGFARESITMLGLMKGARFVPVLGKVGLGANAGLGARLGGEAIRGAVADMVMDTGDGNFANQLEEWMPGLKDSWFTALAQDEDDNIFTSKLKNMLEGALFGLAVDGIMEVFGAVRAGRKAVKAGKSVDEAVDASFNYTQQRELDLFPKDTSPRQMSLEDAGLDLSPRAIKIKGQADRLAENTANSARMNKPGLYEPNERAGVTGRASVNEAMESQAELAKAGFPENGGSNRIWTDDLVREALGTRNAREGIAKVIQAAYKGADLDQLEASLKARGIEESAETIPTIEGVINKGVEYLDTRVELPDGTGEVPIWMTPKGGKVVRALVYDASEQIVDFAKGFRSVEEAGMDAFRQGEELIDRLRILFRFDGLQSKSSGRLLQSRKDVKLNKETINQANIEKQLKETDEMLAGLKEKLRYGDPKAVAEFRSLADSLALAGNDPRQIMDFTKMWRKVSRNTFNGAIYNGHLSGPRSTSRNVIGGLVNTNLRPLTMAMGYSARLDFGRARAALGAYHGFYQNILDSLSIARKSYMSDDSIVVDSARVAGSTKESEMLLERMAAQAKTPAELVAVRAAQTSHHLFNSPWMSWPTRAMRATDDAVRTLAVRMELNSRVYSESLEAGDGIQFNQATYDKLYRENLGMDGKIISQEMISVTDDIVFQKKLTGQSLRLQEFAQENWGLRLFVPFIKTPTNLIRASFDYIPGFNKFADMTVLNGFTRDYRRVMQGTDERAKAIYRGKTALGSLLIGGTVPMVLSGNMTGNGPQDPARRAIWLKKHPPNSIKIGGKWISYQPIEPLNSIMSVAADVAMVGMNADQYTYETAFAQAMYTIASAITNKSYMYGIVQMSKVLDISSGNFPNALISTTADLASIFIPQRQLLMGIDKVLTPGVTEFSQHWQKEIAGFVPGLSGQLGSPRVDIFSGEQIDDANENVFNFFLPFNVKDENNDRVVTFLADNGVNISTLFADELKGMQLSSGQKTALQKGMADYGLRDNLEELMDEEWFQRDVEAWRNSNKPLDDNDRWFRAVKRRFSQARTASVRRLMKDDPIFTAQYEEFLRNQNKRRRGEYADL